MNNIIYANKRKKGEENPITKVYEIIISHNIDEPDYFRLDEVPLRYIKNVIKCDANGDETNIILQEQIGGTPTAGKFVVNYDMGLIYCNESDNIGKIKVSYLGTGSVLLASDVNELNEYSDNIQKKLIPDGSIIIDEDEYYWKNFAENRYIYINQVIPSFNKLDIIFKYELTSKDENDSVLMCQGIINDDDENPSNEKYVGLTVNNTKPYFYSNENTIIGNSQSNVREKYFYRIYSEDGQTFTVYTIKDNGYSLNTLPDLNVWNEEYTFTEDIFTNKNFYIGYDKFNTSKYFHGRIFECIIKCDNNIFFDLNKAQVGIDYINNNCTYIGNIVNPTILNPKIKAGENISLLETEKNTYINFKGTQYIVKFSYSDLTEDNRTIVLELPISEHTPIFLNGVLQILGHDYDYKVLENPGSNKLKVELKFKRVINNDDTITDANIYIIPGLSYTAFYNCPVGQNTILVGRNIQQNTLVFRNGKLENLSPNFDEEDGYRIINNDTLQFKNNFTSNENVAVIFNYNNKLSVFLDEPVDSYDFGIYIPDDTLIFKNGQLLGQYVDWDRTKDETGDDTDDTTIRFTSILTANEWLVASIQAPESIYNMISEKQDVLPNLIPNKVLGNDGNKVQWVDPFFGDIDYHTKIINKPQINSIEVDGNKTSEDYHLQSQIPITSSDVNKVLSNNGSDTLVWMQVDNQLSNISVNPIQNKVVKSALDTKQNNITGAASTITSNDLTTSRAVISNASGKIDVSDTTSTELEYVHGVTSNIQNQLDSKQATITGAASTVVTNDLTTNKVVVSDNNGKIVAGSATSTEVGYLSGVTSAIQTQINSKQNKISAGTANNIVAYSGTEGTVNTLTRKTSIDNISNASDTAIPTEKAVRTELDTKQDEITNDNKLDVNLVNGLSNVATSGSYNDLTEKPTLNGYPISGNKTAEDYNILTGNNLFDIKLKEDTNPDINWACISKKTILNKVTNPTVYNEILNRNNNLELTIDNSFTQVTNNNIQNANVKIINNEIYLFRNVSNKIGLYKCPVNDINNFTLVNECELPSNIGLVDSCWGNDTLLVRTDDNHLYLYETETFTLEDSFEIGNTISGGYNKISYLPNTNKYLFTTPITDENYPIELYILGLNDDPTPQWSITALANIQYDIKNITFIKDITEIDTNTNEEVNKTIYMFGYNDGLYQTDNITDITTYTELVSNCNGNFVKINQVILTEGNNGDSKVSYDEGNTWVNNTLGGVSVVSYKVQQINNNLAIIMVINTSNSIIYRTTDLFNFMELSDNCSIMDFDSLDFNNNLLILTSGTDYSYNEYQTRQYTKTYTINSNTYTITYYVSAKTQTKIVYGTTQNSTLDIVFNYLGYLDYFVLDDVNEQITLPRTKILWTYMYVSDNYIDIGIPNGNYSPIETQINKTNDYTSNSEVTYPSSKALKDGLQSMIPTITWYDTTNGDFQANDTEIQTDLDNVLKVYNNGLLLRVNVDYTTSLVNNKIKITFTTALLGTDQIAVESL